jgi:hypothetical protein
VWNAKRCSRCWTLAHYSSGRRGAWSIERDKSGITIADLACKVRKPATTLSRKRWPSGRFGALLWVASGALRRSGDPPRRPDGLRGASVVQPDGCAEPKESPNEKISKEASWSKFCWIVR